MNELSLLRINEKSPYTVELFQGGFSFITDVGVQYSVHFTEE